MQDKPVNPVLIVGCGDIGRRVAVRLLAAGRAVTGVVRVAEGVVLGQRALDVTQDPGRWEVVPAGGLSVGSPMMACTYLETVGRAPWSSSPDRWTTDTSSSFSMSTFMHPSSLVRGACGRQIRRRGVLRFPLACVLRHDECHGETGPDFVAAGGGDPRRRVRR